MKDSPDQSTSAEIDNKFELQYQGIKPPTDSSIENSKEIGGMDLDGYEDVSDQACYYKSLMKQEENSESVYTLPYHNA